ncbi:MAG: DUF3466 family protein [Armatimonadota bacterium]
MHSIRVRACFSASLLVTLPLLVAAPVAGERDRYQLSAIESLHPDGSAFAEGINDSRQVVGFSTEASGGDYRAFIWDRRSGARPVLPDHPGLSVANSISDSGYVAGWFSSGSATEGFVARGAMVVKVGMLPGGSHSEALDVNDSGHAVGYSLVGRDENGDRLEDEHAFLYRDGVLTDLGTLGGHSSRALALNDDGVVVGAASTPDEKTHAFVWKDGVMRDLGVLPGGSHSVAQDINAEGVIVGSAGTGEWAVPVRLVRWRYPRDTAPKPLEKARDFGVEAAVNDRGVIAYTISSFEGPISPRLWSRGRTKSVRRLAVRHLRGRRPFLTEVSGINGRGDLTVNGSQGGRAVALAMLRR